MSTEEMNMQELESQLNEQERLELSECLNNVLKQL